MIKYSLLKFFNWMLALPVIYVGAKLIIIDVVLFYNQGIL